MGCGVSAASVKAIIKIERKRWQDPELTAGHKVVNYVLYTF